MTAPTRGHSQLGVARVASWHYRQKRCGPRQGNDLSGVGSMRVTEVDWPLLGIDITNMPKTPRDMVIVYVA